MRHSKWTFVGRSPRASFSIIDGLAAKHGEKYRELIEDALRFLSESEPYWDLTEPIDRDAYIADLVARARK